MKSEVVARLRRAAGKEPTGRAEQVPTAAFEARRHRIAQMSAVIDAFGLLDDAAYLKKLEEAASPEDAGVIEARLAAIAAKAGSAKP